MTSPLRIVTFNCRGWNNGSSFVADLLPTCDILLIQEHWLFHENLNALNINDQFVYTAVSGMDSSTFQSGEIGAFIDSQSYDSLIIAGDFNVDFSRICYNYSLLSDFISSLNLCAVDRLFHASIPFTYPMLNLNILLELCLQTSVLFILLCFLHLFWCVFSINNNNNNNNCIKFTY